MTIELSHAKFEAIVLDLNIFILNTASSVQKPGKITFILKVLTAIAKIAATWGLEKQSEKLILLLVRGYQLYISPHKGFSCAYRKLYNQQSCSDYFYNCISDRDLSTAAILLQQRLIDCQQAATILQTTANYRRQKPTRKSQECGSCWDWLDLSFLISDCGDCNDCELGDCDLGGCDLS
ncbi:MAG: membrane protein insertion efficiency factor YidD [Pleurocapsa sp. MO_226.B13]|nr:membrane protein insertion efficiency factor YidD [Pleurocapsa sp. MO_226.B13]